MEITVRKEVNKFLDKMVGYILVDKITNMPSKTLLAVRCRVFTGCQVLLRSYSTFQHSQVWLSSHGISLGSLASVPEEGTGKGL